MAFHCGFFGSPRMKAMNEALAAGTEVDGATEDELAAERWGNHVISWKIWMEKRGWRWGSASKHQELVYKPWANGELTMKHIIEHQDSNWFTMWCPQVRCVCWFMSSHLTILYSYLIRKPIDVSVISSTEVTMGHRLVGIVGLIIFACVCWTYYFCWLEYDVSYVYIYIYIMERLGQIYHDAPNVS